MADAGPIATQVDSHRGESTGNFRFWDVLPVRPNDWMWRIVGARAQGNRLDVILVDGMDDEALDPKTSVTISVWDPEGYSKNQNGFSVANASRATFGDCDVNVAGHELRIDRQGTNRRPLPNLPALTVETGP